MKRILLVFAILFLAGCSASTERPEGIVERWLTSLNQGSAGEPWRWADDPPTRDVGPTWDGEEPGWIDAISIGSARASGDGWIVPFAIEFLDGTATSGDAVVARRDVQGTPPGLFVAEVHLGTPSGTTGRWSEGVNAGAWPVAAALGGVLSVLAVAAVRQVRRS